MPQAIVLAGPNGAGKTTASRSVLANRLNVVTFLNPDIIAQGLSGFAPEAAAYEASSIMLRRLRTLADEGKDFAFETTLAARTYVPWLRQIQTQGYSVLLAYVWLNSPDLAVERVAMRVRLGGHFIPEPTIRQRYVRSWQNFFDLYQPLADRWLVFDNSFAGAHRIIATGHRLNVREILDAPTWEWFSKGPQS